MCGFQGKSPYYYVYFYSFTNCYKISNPQYLDSVGSGVPKGDCGVITDQRRQSPPTRWGAETVGVWAEVQYPDPLKGGAPLHKVRKLTLW